MRHGPTQLYMPQQQGMPMPMQGSSGGNVEDRPGDHVPQQSAVVKEEKVDDESDVQIATVKKSKTTEKPISDSARTLRVAREAAVLAIDMKSQRSGEQSEAGASQATRSRSRELPDQKKTPDQKKSKSPEKITRPDKIKEGKNQGRTA